MRAELLAFNPDPGRLGRLRFIGMRLGIPVKVFPVSQWGLTMGELWQTAPEADEAPAEPPFPEEMLVMCGFSRAQVNSLLAAMKQAHLPPVDLKAILTPTNSGWTPLQLRNELRREHEAMHGGGASAHPQA